MVVDPRSLRGREVAWMAWRSAFSGRRTFNLIRGDVEGTSHLRTKIELGKVRS